MEQAPIDSRSKSSMRRIKWNSRLEQFRFNQFEISDGVYSRRFSFVFSNLILQEINRHNRWFLEV